MKVPIIQLLRATALRILFGVILQNEANFLKISRRAEVAEQGGTDREGNRWKYNLLVYFVEMSLRMPSFGVLPTQIHSEGTE
jgi:hypothetical protein